VSSSSDETQLQLRVGAASLGLLAGLVIGGLGAIALLALGLLQSVPIAVWVFGTSISLASACFAWPSVAFAATFGLAHFVIGVSQGAAVDSSFDIARPEPESSLWFKLLFWVGVSFGLAACVAAWLW
jgi:hypothetical protein